VYSGCSFTLRSAILALIAEGMTSSLFVLIDDEPISPSKTDSRRVVL
jgi:hypothetical protein